jgi:geranylgeranyl diphosphate synthase type II
VVGERLGEAYQVADDLLDDLAMSTEAGKPLGQDAALARPNAVLTLGVAGAIARLRTLVAQAAGSVPECRGAVGLRQLVQQMAKRLLPEGLERSAA